MTTHYSHNYSGSETTKQNVLRLFALLILVEICLLSIYRLNFILGHPSWILQVLFDFDGEANIPTWFSSAQLFAIGLTFFFIGRSSPAMETRRRYFYTLLSLIFIALSLDETAMIHDRLNIALTRFDFLWRFNNRDAGIWIPFYLFPMVVFCLYFHRNFMDLFKTHRKEFLLISGGMTLCLAGCIGLEIFGYKYIQKVPQNIYFHLELCLEEFLEMFGATLILCGALLLYGTTQQRRLTP